MDDCRCASHFSPKEILAVKQKREPPGWNRAPTTSKYRDRDIDIEIEIQIQTETELESGAGDGDGGGGGGGDRDGERRVSRTSIAHARARPSDDHMQNSLVPNAQMLPRLAPRP